MSEFAESTTSGSNERTHASNSSPRTLSIVRHGIPNRSATDCTLASCSPLTARGNRPRSWMLKLFRAEREQLAEAEQASVAQEIARQWAAVRQADAGDRDDVGVLRLLDETA